MLAIFAFAIGAISSWVAVVTYYRAKKNGERSLQEAAIAGVEAQGYELHRYHPPEAVEGELNALPGYVVTLGGVMEGHFTRRRPTSHQIALQRRSAFRVVPTCPPDSDS